MKKITLKEIAKLAGVSQQTASAVLSKNKNDNTRFSEKTASKVKKIAEEYNYRPNRALRSVFEKKHKSIALLFNSIGAITREEINLLLDRTSELGQKLILDKVKNNSILPNCIKENIVDGLYLFENLGDEIDKAIDKYNIPAVYINANMYDCKSPTVNMNENQAMNTALSLFMQSGKKRPLLLLQGSRDDSFNKLRVSGLKEACKINKLEEPFFMEIHERPNSKLHYFDYRELVSNKVLEICKKHPEIDSIISEWRGTTIGVYKACEKMNKSIPNDMAVISLTNIVKEWDLTPIVTCLDIDRLNMTEQGLNLLQKNINNEKCENIVLEYKIREGESV